MSIAKRCFPDKLISLNKNKTRYPETFDFENLFESQI